MDTVRQTLIQFHHDTDVLHVTQKAHGPKGYSFTVTLKQYNKKTSQTDSVRMEPHPPFLMPSAIEARHWGATYALYRVGSVFCNPEDRYLMYLISLSFATEFN